MGLSKFRIHTDSQVARALLRPGSESRRALLAKAQLVGIQYRKLYAENASERAQSPFEQKDQLSVSDPAAFHVRAGLDHLEISVEAPAAEFVERGNDGAVGNDYLKIRLKDGTVLKKRQRGKRSKSTKSGKPNSFIVREAGRIYLMTRSVRPAKGRHLLARAVRSIFR